MKVFNQTTADVFPEVIEMLQEQDVTESRAGDTREVLNVAIKSENPRRRWMYRKRFNLAFALQESFAYWQGLNPGHVERYNTAMEQWMVNGVFPGSAYGDRMRNTAGHDQIQRAIEQLESNTETRRAVISVFQPAVEDFEGGDVSCTSQLQLFIRNGKLHMTAILRSQDMFWGYPYDTQNNQFIQEAIAGRLGAELGTYTHIMNSCHYYTDFREDIEYALEDHTAHETEDFRLDPDAHDHVIHFLSVGLGIARKGGIPEHHIKELDRTSSQYADWLRVMTAYEQKRFHDDLEQAKTIAAEVKQEAWSTWLHDYLS